MAQAIFWNKYRGDYESVEVRNIAEAKREARGRSALRVKYFSRNGERVFARSDPQRGFIEV